MTPKFSLGDRVQPSHSQQAYEIIAIVITRGGCSYTCRSEADGGGATFDEATLSPAPPKAPDPEEPSTTAEEVATA